MKNENRTVRRAWRRARLHLVLGAIIFFGVHVWADEVKTVTVVYTGSNNGMLKACACPGNPRGGLARRASVLREIRSEVGEILLLDSGDPLSHTKHLAKDEVGGADEVVLRIYGILQYDAVAIGDQEFANGRAFFAERVLTSGLPMVSATLKDAKTKKGMASPYIVKELSGVRVAVIGLVGPDAFEFMEPSETEDITIADPVKTMQIYLPELRRQADVVVVLSHLGDEGDVALAECMPGMIDVIVGGHTQVLLWEPLKVGGADRVQGTLIVQAGPDGEYVGRLDLKVDRKGRIVETRNQIIPLDGYVPDDPEIARIVEAYFSSRTEQTRSHAE